MQVKVGSTSQQIPIKFITVADGTPATVDHATAGLSLWYWRPGAAQQAITPVALASLATAFTAGGVEPIANGVSRVDVPNAAFAAGVDRVRIGGGATGIVAVGDDIDLVVNTAADVYGRLGAPAGASIAADIANVITQGNLNWSSIPATHSGALQAVNGAGDQVTLAASAVELAGAYVGSFIYFDTAAGISWAVISAYNEGTKVATLDRTPVPTPAADDVAKISGYSPSAAGLSAADIRAALGMASPDLDTQLDAVGSAITGLSIPTANAIAAAVWAATISLTPMADGDTTPNAGELLVTTLARVGGWALSRSGAELTATLPGGGTLVWTANSATDPTSIDRTG